jgi:8-amino-7-oxononanoate synthase
VWVATESVFSMDGDRAPLGELVALKKRFDLNLYLDEAHAFGIFGPTGAGCASELGLDADFDVIVGTFGKALASYGAFLAVDATVREVLVNRMRTLIFSTGLPPVSLLWTKRLVERLPDFGARREKLHTLVSMLSDDPQATHIIPIPAGENAAAIKMSDKFREAGFWTTPVRWPTVPKGQARVRVSLTAAMDAADIERFKEVWNSIG